MNDSEPSSNSTFEKLCTLRFGASSKEQMANLQKELKRFRKSASVALSEQAITNWFKSDARPIRSVSSAFLHSYLTANVNQANLTAELRGLYDRVEASLRPPQNDFDTRALPRAARHADIYATVMVNILFDRSRRSDRNELDDFFYCSPHNSVTNEKDHSFYAMYRYSSTGRILKTLLVCKRPQKDYGSSFSYLTFMRGDPKVFPDLHRESEGVILKWETSYQFLGFSYRMPSDSADDPAQTIFRRAEAKSRARAVELIAFEYSEIELEHGLFSGVAMTMAAANQPVITRVAMLHLGTVGSLTRNISHSDFQPTVFDVKDFAGDLRSMMSRLQKLGCKRFAKKLSDAFTHPDWTLAESKRVAEEITTMLDNTPAWELSAANPNPPKELHGRGAIETFSRSGNRPRS